MINKVLISQGTQPFAQRVAKLLPAQQILFCAADELPDVLLRTGNYLRIPSPEAPSFVHEMLKTCLDYQVDVFIPLGVSELRAMAVSRELFSEYGVDVWVPDPEELDTIAVIENPPRQLPLLMLHGGVPVVGPETDGRYGTLSGVFIMSDSGNELALCGLADQRR